MPDMFEYLEALYNQYPEPPESLIEALAKDLTWGRGIEWKKGNSNAR